MTAQPVPARAVLDTSVLVPPSVRRELQQAATSKLFTGLWSPWIIAELNCVLVWRWIKDPPPGQPRDDLSDANERRCSDNGQRMMDWLLPAFEVVTPLPPYPAPWPELTDRWDEPILATAILGQAQYVVSENTRHFPPPDAAGRHVYEGIEYIRASPFLELIRAEREARR